MPLLFVPTPPQKPVFIYAWLHNYNLPFTPPCQLLSATRVFSHPQAQDEFTPFCPLWAFSVVYLLRIKSGEAQHDTDWDLSSRLAIRVDQLNLIGETLKPGQTAI